MRALAVKNKSTRNLERTRKEILKVAFLEVFHHGFQGVSVDEIVKKTSVTKGAFYHLFPTKLDMGYALVEEVIEPLILERWILPLEEAKNPLEGILKQLKLLIGDCDPSQLKLGCPLNNLVQEMTPLDPGFRRRLRKSLNLWIDEMERHLIRAKKGKFIKSDVNCRELARFVVMTHEGFYGMLKGMGEPGIFEDLYRSLERYFQAIAV